MGPTPRWDEVEPLLARARAGDAEARNDLAALLRPALEDLAHRRFTARGHVTATDVAQEALAAALAGLDDYRGTHGAASFWDWLRTILHNRAAYWERYANFRKRPPAAGARTIDDADPPAAGPSPGTGLAQLEDAADRNRRIAAALDKIDPGDRALVVGVYFDGKPLQALADEHGLPLQTVKDRLRRAKRELRPLLGEPGA